MAPLRKKITAVRRTTAPSEASPGRLTRRELNRAMLARQLLLERATLPASAAVRRLVGLQAQLPRPPYIGLWTRLVSFAPSDLAGRLEARDCVRATAMRGTLHVMTAEDYAEFRLTLQPMLTRALESMPAERRKGIDVEAIADEGRRFFQDGPRTMEELRAFLAGRHPKLDVRMMAYAVRLTVPLVQVPGAGSWGFPPEPAFALAEIWLGRPLIAPMNAAALVMRYLAAFGPATARDMQTWSGLQGVGEVLEALRPQLRVFADEDERELFDLPEATRPADDTPAAPRFLPEYDNVLLAHFDRSRIVPEEFRPQVFLPGLRVAATFLIDGFVRGAWRIERKKKTATLVIEPFAPVARADRTALVEEAERLVRFVEDDASTWEVRIAK